MDNVEKADWCPLVLNTGFYYSDLSPSLVKFADTPERKEAVQAVAALFEKRCSDPQEWREASSKLARLCQAHPDAYQESGTWYDGAPSIVAMAAAKEIAMCVSLNLAGGEDPRDHIKSQVRGRSYKVLKYVLRAYANATPEQALGCVKWLEKTLSLHPLA